MELRKAIELCVQHYDSKGVIRVDKNGYICLNDLNSFFPNKRLDNWLSNAETKELIKAIETVENIDFQNTCNSRYFGDTDNTGFQSMICKRGKNGGTYACEELALDFAMWLSPEFKVKIYKAYLRGIGRQEKWDIQRELSIQGFKMMQESIKETNPTNQFAYSNEARLINIIVFGESKFECNPRDTATKEQLDEIWKYETKNSCLIDAGFTYEERKEILLNYKNKKGVNCVIKSN